MTVELLYFAWVREALGRNGEVIDLPTEVGTVSDLLGWLDRRAGADSVFSDTRRLRCAIDQAMAPLDAPLAGAKEVAIFPHVTGG